LAASSMRQPSVPGSAPDTVPEANRSPGRTDVPLTVAWASIWGKVQYWSARRQWAIEAGGMSLTRIHWLWIDTSSRMSYAARAGGDRYADGSGSWTGPSTRYGSSASRVTIQGDTDVAKDLPRNGPRGCDSRPWM